MSTFIEVARFSVRAMLLVALLLALGERLADVGPTFGDPDPEGYVSYARALGETWSLQAHRRLPGYPAIIAAVTSVLPYPVPWSMFYFHVALTIAFAAVLTLLVLRVFGFYVAALFLAILSINSHFARVAIAQFADLPATALVYLLAIPAVLFVRTTGVRRVVALAAFVLLAVVTFLVHPSNDPRLQIILWSAIAIFALDAARRGGWAGLRQSKRLLASLIALSAATLLAGQLTQRNFQFHDDAQVMVDPPAAPSSAAFLNDWVTYRMLLCLPPAGTPSPLDVRIELVKNRIATRQGYAVQAVVPPGYAPEFLALMRSEPIPRDIWHRRLLAHPLALPLCALREMRVKWHYLVRNITPFTAFQNDKTFITPDYPPPVDSLRDAIFWRTGISLFRSVQAGASDASIRAAFRYELWRIAIVLALTGLGLVLLERRFPRLGLIFVVSTFGWFVVLAFVLPVETRYFIASMPVFYLAQALAAVALVRLVFVKWLGAGLRKAFAQASA